MTNLFWNLHRRVGYTLELLIITMCVLEIVFRSCFAPTPEPPGPSAILPKRPFVERPGLCVVCQDKEANMAVVDCGYVPHF